MVNGKASVPLPPLAMADIGYHDCSVGNFRVESRVRVCSLGLWKKVFARALVWAVDTTA